MKDELFEKLISVDNIFSAFSKSIKGRRFRSDVLSFKYHMEKKLVSIKRELELRIYQCGEYFKFVVHDSKKRIIWAAVFRDRIIHHMICNVIEPIFEMCFVFDSYACRKGKGAWRAILRLQEFINILTISGGGGKLEGKIYCLKCDISKYFDNVDHEVLKRIISKKIKSPGLIWLLYLIIDSYGVGIGIPIGNLTSQLFANIYLNELDHFIKDQLGIKYYLRYMDDFVILSRDKNELFKLKGLIKEFLETELKLKLHPKKSEVFPINRGIDFLGYVVFYKDIWLRKSTVKRYFKKIRKRLLRAEYWDLLEELDKCLKSWYSYYHHGKHEKLLCKMYAETVESAWGWVL